MRNAWTSRLLAVLIAAPIMAALLWTWTKVDAGFAVNVAFFGILIGVVAPLAERMARALVRS